MAPFCGYHMADYFRHWLETGHHRRARPPKIFYINWFRQDNDGNLLWPGHSENSRVLAWIFRRCQNKTPAVETPIGLLPPLGDGGIDTTNLATDTTAMAQLLSVDEEEWRQEILRIHNYYARFGDKLPPELRAQLHQLETRLLHSNLIESPELRRAATANTPKGQTESGGRPHFPHQSTHVVSYAQPRYGRRRTYSIEVEGDLNDRARSSFPEMAPVQRNGNTVLVGALRDQAELHALLRRCQDLELTLISVHSSDPD